MNRRRKLLAATVLGTLFGQITGLAQPAARSARIGYIAQSRSSVSSRLIDPFKQGMREFGYVEGRNIVFDVRFAEGKIERLPALAAELVALKPDLIVAVGTLSIRAVQQATATIPIVMCPATDPVGSGFVASLARPGGNITGVVNMTLDMSSKALDLLHRFMPSIKRFAVLMTSNPTHTAQVSEIQSAAQAARLALVSVRAVAPAELEDAFATIMKEKCGAVVVLADPLFVDQRQHIAELCAKSRLPAVYQYREHVEVGGLLSYGPNLTELYRRATFYADKILRGAKPGDLPVEQPTAFELYINRKTANALGLTIPAELLLRADKVIE